MNGADHLGRISIIRLGYLISHCNLYIKAGPVHQMTLPPSPDSGRLHHSGAV
jgi:hypothetical protein